MVTNVLNVKQFIIIIWSHGHGHTCVFESVSYRGEEHCEEVDRRLGDVAATDGHYDGGQEGQVTDCEQQSCSQLMTI